MVENITCITTAAPILKVAVWLIAHILQVSGNMAVLKGGGIYANDKTSILKVSNSAVTIMCSVGPILE